MKLGKTVLVEIIAIIQNAMITGDDASEALRKIDVDAKDGVLELSDEYKKNNGRE